MGGGVISKGMYQDTASETLLLASCIVGRLKTAGTPQQWRRQCGANTQIGRWSCMRTGIRNNDVVRFPACITIPFHSTLGDIHTQVLT